MNVPSIQPAELAAETPEAFSVSAAVSLQERRYRTLKSGDTFGVFDHGGDMISQPGSIDGLYFRDTRHLSQFDLVLGGVQPLLLSSTLAADGVMLTSDLSNSSTSDLGQAALDQGAIHIQRSVFLGNGACHARIAVRNYAFEHLRIRLEFRFQADFADLFEVRGMCRPVRGTLMPAALTDDSTTLSYCGLDRLVRTTRLAFEPAPQLLTGNRAVFDLALDPLGQATIFVDVSCAPPAEPAGGLVEPASPRASFLSDYVTAKRDLRASTLRAAAISSTHEGFKQTLRRSAADLRMLLTEKPTGPYPYAGIPWFSTAFGRDGLITALLTLSLDPDLARGVLGYLAQEQATEFDPASEAEPGKILHEVRGGEMAAMREVPFRRYYGSVDSTPLFVMLAGAYLDRTGDLATLRALWPNIEAALGWIDRRADANGFVTYERSTADGLANQGWKDSHDAISHAEGTLARGAIALCEVQGYVYAAHLAGARIARQLGDTAKVAARETKAEALRQTFEERFWCERLGIYALALDGAGRQCQVRSSNAGQLLMTGIVSPARARMVASALMDPTFFTGWGIRTLASTEARYNPMSYHNGSVWPHDNALIALGMARMGLRAEAVRLFEALQAAATAMDLHRLPELFCGFPRRPSQGPTSYPVACTPQAWASAAIPGLVQACLGLTFDPAAQSVRFAYPALPNFLDSLSLRNLGLNDSRVSVQITRLNGELSVSVTGRAGPSDIHVVTTS
jgi:glycogen debranching enzyme